MQLRASFDDDGDLKLIGATYSRAEFGALHDVLSRLGIIRMRNPPSRDRAGREVNEYSIARRSIKRLEKVLGGHFEADGRFIPTRTGKGRRYACREVTTGGRGHGCEEITASDDSAVVKCALIAGQNNWFGSEPSAGACSGRA